MGHPVLPNVKKWAKFPSTNDFHTKFFCEQQYLDVYPLFDFCSSRQIPFISVANMTRCTREEGGARYLTINVLKPQTTCGSPGCKKYVLEPHRQLEDVVAKNPAFVSRENFNEVKEWSKNVII